MKLNTLLLTTALTASSFATTHTINCDSPNSMGEIEFQMGDTVAFSNGVKLAVEKANFWDATGPYNQQFSLAFIDSVSTSTYNCSESNPLNFDGWSVGDHYPPSVNNRSNSEDSWRGQDFPAIQGVDTVVYNNRNELTDTLAAHLLYIYSYELGGWPRNFDYFEGSTDILYSSVPDKQSIRFSVTTSDNIDTQDILRWQAASEDNSEFQPFIYPESVSLGQDYYLITDYLVATPYAYDSTTGQTLLFLSEYKTQGVPTQYGYVLSPGDNRVTTRSGELWNVYSDTSMGMYSFEFNGAVDVVLDWMDSLYFCEFELEEPASDSIFYGNNERIYTKENSSISIYSFSRDTLYGEFEKYQPVRTVTQISDYYSIEVAESDTLLSILENDTIAMFEVTDLFVGTTVMGETRGFVQTLFHYDDPSVSLNATVTPKLSQGFKGEQSVKIFSPSGRMVHQFKSSYSNMNSAVQKLSLSAGVYFIHAPQFVQRISIMK